MTEGWRIERSTGFLKKVSEGSISLTVLSKDFLLAAQVSMLALRVR